MPQHPVDFDSEIRHRGGSSVIESLVSPSSGTVLPVTPPVVVAATAPSGNTGLHSEIGILMCRCAMIHEDSLEAYDNDADDANVTTIDQSHSDGELAEDESPVGQPELDRSFSNTLEVPMPPHAASTSGSRPLVSVRSSPQLLNEICEETADDNDDVPTATAVMQTRTRRTSADQSRHLDRLHRVHRRKLASMVPRVASCSSSDASDTDEMVDQKQRKQKPSSAAPASVKYLGRRDSSEHSSDNDSQPCGGGAAYPGVSNISSGLSAARRSSDSQCGNRQGQGTDSGRTKRAESEHSYQRHALNWCLSGGRWNSTIIADWKSLDSHLVLQMFSDCYSEEVEDAFFDGSTTPPPVVNQTWIANARNQLSDLVQKHSNDSYNVLDLSVIDGLMMWCSGGGLHLGGNGANNLGINSNSVAVLTGVGGVGSHDSRLRARKVSL